MTTTEVLKMYAQIKLVDGTLRERAVRTRNAWNNWRTGKFLAYDQSVVDAQGFFTCPNCHQTELLWVSQFCEDNEHQINCDVCDVPLVS